MPKPSGASNIVAQTATAKVEPGRRLLLNQAGIRKSETSDYESYRLITQLWGNHIHIRGYKRILYTLQMMDEPEIFTWREFEDFMARHEDPRTHEDIERSVRKIASAQQRSPAEAATELWSAALAGYQNHLSVAASASLLKSHEEAMAHAANLLRFFDRVISLSPLCTPDQRVHAFEKLLFISLEWAHFRGNTADKAARAAEEKLLNYFLSKAGPNSLDYLAIVESQCREASFHGGIGEARTELCNRIQLTSSVAIDIAYDRIISIFTSSSSVGELFQPNQPVRLGELLLDPNGSLWSKSSKNSLLNILKTASQCPNIQVNAMQLIKELSDGSNDYSLSLQEKRAKFIEHTDLVVALWKAALASPFQFRSLKSVREARGRLVNLGIKDSFLIVPDWLQEMK